MIVCKKKKIYRKKRISSFVGFLKEFNKRTSTVTRLSG